MTSEREATSDQVEGSSSAKRVMTCHSDTLAASTSSAVATIMTVRIRSRSASLRSDSIAPVRPAAETGYQSL